MNPRFLSPLAAAILIYAVRPADAGSAIWTVASPDSDWLHAANWLPNTVPNGSGDTATFGVSANTSVVINGDVPGPGGVTVAGIIFQAGASAYTISTGSSKTLTLSGSGILNNSGTVQNFNTGPTSMGGRINFTNSASAGDLTVITNRRAGEVSFADTATGGTATFINQGASNGLDGPAYMFFHDHSTAGSASFTNQGGLNTAGGNIGGQTYFDGSSSGGNGTFTNQGGSAGIGGLNTQGGAVIFQATSTAGNGMFINNGGGYSVPLGGGSTQFRDSATADSATLIANGSSTGGNGGVILFTGNSTGGTARVEVFGNGYLDISSHGLQGVAIGSLEGSGLVTLGANSLSVGSNNLSTTFSGVIQDSGGSASGTGGSLSKIGTGTLTLSGSNAYTGGTTTTSGTLLVNNTAGSGTGAGAVAINGGTLGGTSSGVAGPVTVGGNATLNAGTSGVSQGVMFLNGAGTGLSLQNNSIFHFDLGGTTPGNGTTGYDQINVANSASIAGNISGAVVSGFLPGVTDVYYVLAVGATRTGVFANAPEGATIDFGNGLSGEITYQANWTGTQVGSSLVGGNDIAIFNVAVVPEPSTWALALFGGVGVCVVRRLRARFVKQNRSAF